MTIPGEGSSVWIIERITNYAKATNEPFSERDLQMLRFSVSEFMESDRDDFLRLDAKTVRMVRATMADEKMTGIKCVKARNNLFIPPEWKQKYLEMYETNVPWMISHCSQSAMLSEPEPGEEDFWRSPQITTGNRPSVILLAQKPPVASGSSREEFKLSSAEEFDLLYSSLNGFFLMADFIFSLKALANHALGKERENREEFSKAAQMGALEIAIAISDLDDQVTASFFTYMMDEDIHSSEIDQREKLRSLCDPACYTVFSKNQLSKVLDLSEDSCSKPGLFYLSSILELDQSCVLLKIPTIATRFYAAKAANLAFAFKRSSVFSSNPMNFGQQLLTFASVLKRSIEVVASSQFAPMSFEQVGSEICRDLPKETSAMILGEMIDMDADILSEMKVWTEKFKERCNFVSQFGL